MTPRTLGRLHTCVAAPDRPCDACQIEEALADLHDRQREGDERQWLDDHEPK